MKQIFVVRHCEAEGQPKQAPLTQNGVIQAKHLSNFLSDFNIERVISSPYLRAIQSAKPFSKRADLEIEIDQRLRERVLSTNHLPDWFDKLKQTFTDFDLTFPGGESSRIAMNRIVDALNDIQANTYSRTVIFTHGNIMSLLLNYYNENFGFETWEKMTNPDVFLLTFKVNDICIQRIWTENY